MSYKVVIGFDSTEVAAYHTLSNSILTRASKPVQIIPLHEPTLRASNLYWRQDKGSTEFSFSRFLTPYVSTDGTYRGDPVLFLDCDMVVMGDITELWDYIGGFNAVSVCKHQYTPPGQTKFGGNIQNAYPQKLWSAVCMYAMGNQKVRNLTPRAVNEMTGADLHRFKWVCDDPDKSERIGEIPEEWHWVPNHSEERVSIDKAKLIHYTEGGPWHSDYKDKGSESERIWLEEHSKIVSRSVL